MTRFVKGDPRVENEQMGTIWNRIYLSHSFTAY